MSRPTQFTIKIKSILFIRTAASAFKASVPEESALSSSPNESCFTPDNCWSVFFLGACSTERAVFPTSCGTRYMLYNCRTSRTLSFCSCKLLFRFQARGFLPIDLPVDAVRRFRRPESRISPLISPANESRFLPLFSKAVPLKLVSRDRFSGRKAKNLYTTGLPLLSGFYPSGAPSIRLLFHPAYNHRPA
jgi:hypothetical protein